MKNFTSKNRDQIIKEMEKHLESIGQANSLPLFNSAPDVVLFGSVSGEIVKAGDFFQFRVKDSKDNLRIAYSISGTAEESADATMNIGTFTCLRDYTAKVSKNVFIAGQTQRDFAYSA